MQHSSLNISSFTMLNIAKILNNFGIVLLEDGIQHILMATFMHRKECFKISI
ncbi:MAG: hypothetical protein QXS74_08845 [Nitrososphaeria archaeon]